MTTPAVPTSESKTDRVKRPSKSTKPMKALQPRKSSAGPADLAARFDLKASR